MASMRSCPSELPPVAALMRMLPRPLAAWRIRPLAASLATPSWLRSWFSTWRAKDSSDLARESCPLWSQNRLIPSPRCSERRRMKPLLPVPRLPWMAMVMGVEQLSIKRDTPSMYLTRPNSSLSATGAAGGSLPAAAGSVTGTPGASSGSAFGSGGGGTTSSQAGQRRLR